MVGKVDDGDNKINNLLQRPHASISIKMLRPKRNLCLVQLCKHHDKVYIFLTRYDTDVVRAVLQTSQQSLDARTKIRYAGKRKKALNVTRLTNKWLPRAASTFIQCKAELRFGAAQTDAFFLSIDNWDFTHLLAYKAFQIAVMMFYDALDDRTMM